VKAWQFRRKCPQIWVRGVHRGSSGAISRVRLPSLHRRLLAVFPRLLTRWETTSSIPEAGEGQIRLTDSCVQVGGRTRGGGAQEGSRRLPSHPSRYLRLLGILDPLS
jgi:hypothetical protein